MNSDRLPHDPPSSQPLLMDCHVHLHPDFDLSAALDAAMGHMRQSHSGDTGVLMLTEMPGVDRFSDLHGQIGVWAVSPTVETCSVVARHPSGFALVVIAGHQIVTREKLEVLMLGARMPVPSSQSLTDTLQQCVDVGAIAVLPFGFGKWTGERKQVVAELAARPPMQNVFFADTGIRRQGGSRPPLLGTAETSGWKVLAGTDPLPFRGQVDAVGSYGCVLSGSINPSRPFADLAVILSTLSDSPDTYGSLQSTVDFARQQFAMQWRKRFK